MNQRADIDNFETLFLDDIPMLDVRAPVEFTRGAFPTATNRPLLDDRQRELIGTRYKQQGQDAAIELGYELATDDIREARLKAWSEFCEQNPNGYLYCFRGGLRSRLTQEWLREEGIHYPLVVGGYKAMRTYLLGIIEHTASGKVITVAGLTGSAKGKVIDAAAGGIDLEKHAHHRGSSFGAHPTPQPTQINFENAIAIDILRKKAELLTNPLVVEDEGSAIGSLSIPPALLASMKQADVVVVNVPWEERVHNIIQEYAVTTLDEFRRSFGEEQAWPAYREWLETSLLAIKRRLGGERYQRALHLMRGAVEDQENGMPAGVHTGWVEILLKEYYDPMYSYQLEKKQERIRFRGSIKEVIEYLSSRD